jgi:RNA polymerase sigma-70 factor (ECF subfamily)
MDGSELARLVDRHAAALVLYARQWCPAPEDVVQDAFLKLVALPRPPDQPLPWLFRVVRNRAVSAARAERRRRRHESAAAAGAAPWFVPDPGRGMDAAALRDALAGLPLEQREVIVAHVWGGLTFEQAAALAGCSTSMAYRRFVAGVSALRGRLGGVPCPSRPRTPS